jgi:nicotinamidase-related amidase
MLEVNNIYDMEKELQGRLVKLEELDKKNTVIIIVDMVKGFVHEGILSSPRIVDIIDSIKKLNKQAEGYKKLFFLDEHEENSVEFKAYAKHCLRGTSESELIEELKAEDIIHENTKLITKNSTNGFHAPGFKSWLEENEESVQNYIVVGCEVDICVSHFATTLKTYFNEHNLDKRIIVPINAVETFDFGTHNGDLMKVIALWEMKSNGIEIVEEVV